MKHILVVAAVGLILWGAANAAIVQIEWGPEGHFAKELTLAPGKFVEACDKLPIGTVVQWSFDAEVRMDFNLHFHESKTKVVFPAKVDGSSQANGMLKAELTQDFCWMWTNTSAGEAKLKVQMKRAPGN